MSKSAHDFLEERLFSQPPDTAQLGVTADGHVFGTSPQSDGRIRFVWDGVAGEPFDRIGTTVFWSDDARHVAYMGLRGLGSFFVGRDAREDPTFEFGTAAVMPTFSADGAHLAYSARVAGDYRLILDGEAIGEVALAPIAAVFSPDGARLAYVETNGNGELRIVLDGAPGSWFTRMRNAQGAMQFSPDSRRFAYYRIEDKGGAQWVVDGHEQRWFKDDRPFDWARFHMGVTDPPVLARFSPDGRRFAYAAGITEKGVAVIEDDVPGPLFKGVWTPVFSPDSRHLAYGALTFAGKGVLVIDGVAGREWPAKGSLEPVFSPDSEHVAATFYREEGGLLRKRGIQTILVDDRILAEEAGDDASRWPVFSPDGKRVAWWLKRGAEFFMVVNDEPTAVRAPSEPVFTSSGHLIFAGGADGAETILVDTKLGPRARGLRPSFMGVPLSERGDFVLFRVSPDGEHVAWAGVFGESADESADPSADVSAKTPGQEGPGLRPVIDDRIGPRYDKVLGWAFDDDGTATWFVQRGEVVYRVRAWTANGTTG